jgi:hypothetical protein
MNACMYDDPIYPNELTPNKGFLQAGKFVFNGKHYIMIFTLNGPVFFDDQKNQTIFGDEVTIPIQCLVKLDIIDIINQFSRDFDFDCGGHKSKLYKSRVKMFCSGWLREEDGTPIFEKGLNVGIFESKLRFKLLCAFGLLRNFINHGMFNLMIRGGMALRMNLPPESELNHPDSAYHTDMDGLVIVNPLISNAMLNDFKTTFMKLLVLAIKNSIEPNDTLICRDAKGDRDTIKIMINRKGAKLELGDIGFKRVNNVIQKYSHDPIYLAVDSMFFFPYTWVFPSREALQSEYDYLVEKTKHQISSPLPMFSNKSKLINDLKKFTSKRDTMIRHGGKKITGHRCKIKTRKYRTNKRH